MKKLELSEQEWRERLSAEQYNVLREAGTERPFTGKYNGHKEKGAYHCAACGNELFKSDTKFESHCGWPAFFDVIAEGKVIEKRDTTHGMIRTEVLCAGCNSHLGHVFPDGPPPTGVRYCINSVCLDFKEPES